MTDGLDELADRDRFREIRFAAALANAFFVASEFAIVKIRSTRLEQLAAAGNRRAKAVRAIVRRLDAYLSANQLGITLASLGLGWVGEAAFARLLLPLLAVLGGAATAASHTLAATLSFLLITFLHTVLGELAPKSLAIQRTESVALWTAAPLPQSCSRTLVRSESARGPRIVGVVDTLHATAADLSPIKALARIVASLPHLA